MSVTVGQKYRYVGEQGRFFTPGKEYLVTSRADDSLWFKIDDDVNGNHGWEDDQSFHCEFKLVPETLPVRTVTRHEIVPGEYGAVSVKRYDRDPADHVRVSLFNQDEMYRALDAAELRAAARVFVSLAEALEQD